MVLHSPWLALATLAFGLVHVPLSQSTARRWDVAPGARSSLARVERALVGRVCVVTGANSGIGKAIALGLAKRGATLVMVCRDRERGERAHREITARSENPNATLLLADLSIQTEIRALVAELDTRFEKVHLLVNSAGASSFERKLTSEDLEASFALNVLAPFLLTRLLLPKLLASAPARIVTVTGSYPKQARFPFEDPQLEHDFRAMGAVSRDNLAKLLLTEEFARRLEGKGVTSNCVHPGAVRTALQRKLPWGYRLLVYPMLPFFQSPERGARGPLYLATARELSGVSGRYFRGPHLAPRPQTATGDAARLWDLAEHLTQPACEPHGLVA